MMPPIVNPVALVYSIDVIKASYAAVLKIHEQAGQRVATLLVLAAFIIEVHSRMVPCEPDETLAIVRRFVFEIRNPAKPGDA